MNSRIELCLTNGLAHIAAGLPNPNVLETARDFDTRLILLQTGLRSGKGEKYLDVLTNLLEEKNGKMPTNLNRDFVKAVHTLLKFSIQRNVLKSDLKLSCKKTRDGNIFELDINKDSLQRLSLYNKTNIRYYNVLQYGTDRIEKDLRKYYPNATVRIALDCHEPDFLSEPYIYRGDKYILVYPIMPPVIIWNGYPGVYNKGPKQ